jgi:hypothetical protein
VIKEAPEVDDITKILSRVNKLLQTLIVKLQIKADGICFNIFDETYKEVMAVRYGNEEIYIEIDLPFKEIITIKAFGLEVQSKESLVGLEKLAKKILENLKDINELHNID